MTVFLTYGQVRTGGGRADDCLLESLGAKFRRLHLPNSLGAKLSEIGVDYCLGCAREYGLDLIEVIEAFPSRNARYFGVRIQCRKENRHEQDGNHLD